MNSDTLSPKSEGKNYKNNEKDDKILIEFMNFTGSIKSN